MIQKAFVFMTFIFCCFARGGESYPKIIKDVIDKKIKSCHSENKGQLTIANQAVQGFYLNDDKIKDYLVDSSGFECTSSAAMRAGSENIRVQLYLSKAKNKWKLAWSKEVLAYQFLRPKSQLIIELRDSKDPLKVVKKALSIKGTQVSF